MGYTKSRGVVIYEQMRRENIGAQGTQNTSNIVDVVIPSHLPCCWNTATCPES